MIERLQGPDPRVEGWWYGRKRGHTLIEPVKVDCMGITPLSAYWYGTYLSISAFDWFGEVHECREIKRSEA